MGTFAVLDDNNFVTNRIVAETLEDAESVTERRCIECDGTSLIGDQYIDGKFVNPAPVETIDDSQTDISPTE
jgi:hypothetical protein